MMNIRNFDLNLLVIFKELFETNSVSKTAQNLALSQPAISHALNRLRQSFEDELFIRTKRTLVPTDKARKLGPLISNHIKDLQSTLFVTEDWDERTAKTSFTFSGTSYDASVWFPELMADMSVDAPNVKARFKGIVVDQFLERMVSGEVDISFAGNLDYFPNFRIETLAEWDMCIIAHKESRKYRKRITQEDYLKAQHVLYTPTEKPGSEVDDILKSMGLVRNVSVRTPYLNSIPNLIVKRDYLAIVPRFFAKSIKDNYDIRLIEVPFELPGFKHQMVWHKSKDSSIEHQWLRNYIRSNYKDWMNHG